MSMKLKLLLLYFPVIGIIYATIDMVFYFKQNNKMVLVVCTENQYWLSMFIQIFSMAGVVILFLEHFGII